MNHSTTCKFCRKPITVEIDDDYSITEDPHKLLPLACCNRCADIRIERRVLEAKIKSICMIRYLDKRVAESRKDMHRQMLDKLMKQYANMIARFHYLDGMSWDDEALNLIMEKPGSWASVLKELWKMFAACNPERV